MPATGALIGTPASISDRVDEPHTEAIEVEPLDDQHLGHETQRVRPSPRAVGMTGSSAARRAHRGRSHGAWARA